MATASDRRSIDIDDEPARRSGLPPVAKYVCFGAFVLSAGLAVPFFWAKSGAAIPRSGANISSGSGPAVLLARPSHSVSVTAGAVSQPPPRLLKSVRPNGESASPDTLGAIKHAFKALGAATVIVGATAGTAFAGITLGLGITTLGEFHTVMHSLVRSYFPELHVQLHSVSDTAAAQHRIEVWEHECVEKALEDAYSRGGWRAWVVEARKQLERERAVAQRVAETGR